jgi:biopolymer transport protein ExbD
MAAAATIAAAALLLAGCGPPAPPTDEELKDLICRAAAVRIEESTEFFALQGETADFYSLQNQTYSMLLLRTPHDPEGERIFGWFPLPRLSVTADVERANRIKARREALRCELEHLWVQDPTVIFFDIPPREFWPHDYLSYVYPEDICHVSRQDAEGAITGTVSFRREKLLAGRFDFTVRLRGRRWRVEEFRMPVRGLKTTLKSDGRWRTNWFRPFADSRPFLLLALADPGDAYAVVGERGDLNAMPPPGPMLRDELLAILRKAIPAARERPGSLEVDRETLWRSVHWALGALRSGGWTEVRFLADEDEALPIAFASPDVAAKAWCDETSVRVAVGADGTLGVEGLAAPKEAIVGRIRRVCRTGGQPVAVVSAEPEARYEAVFFAMEACCAAGIEKFILRTHRAGEDVAALGRIVLESGRRLVPGAMLPENPTAPMSLVIDEWYVVGPFAIPEGRYRGKWLLPEWLYLQNCGRRPPTGVAPVDVKNQVTFWDGSAMRLPAVDIDTWGYEVKVGTRLVWHWLQPNGLPADPLRAVSSESEGARPQEAPAVNDKADPGGIWYAYTEIHSPLEQMVRLALGVQERGVFWVNGREVWDTGESPQAWRMDQATCEVCLRQGLNPVLLRLEDSGGKPAFSVVLLLDPPPGANR